MIRIKDYYIVDFDMNDAVGVVSKYGDGDLLAGMEKLQGIWDNHVKESFLDERTYGDDDDFFDHWGYEMSAYNVVFENMSKLFVGAK